MNDKYKWNPVYNLIMRIKEDYYNKFHDNEKDFKVWLEKLNNKKYNDIFNSLQTNQKDNYLLIRYGIAEMQEGMWEDENSIYRECRSLVIDLEKEEIVTCPFRKFFNLNEVKENNIDIIKKDIEKAKIFEITNKLDGSMQCARWYNNNIFMNGSMALDKNASFRLEEGISMLNDNYKRMIKENQDYTFIFEYISLKDVHVVLYNKSQEGLYLIGIRNCYTGEELSYTNIKIFSKKYNVPMTNIESISFGEMLSQMKTYKSSDKEGWVLNIDGHKVKVKCDDYVQLHRILDKYASVNVIIKNIADDKFDDMMSKIPDTYKDRMLMIANKIIEYRDNTLNRIDKYYKLAPKGTRKEFMIWVTNNCPKNIQGYVRNIYLNKPNNVLMKGYCGYKKLKDMDIADSFSELFESMKE